MTRAHATLALTLAAVLLGCSPAGAAITQSAQPRTGPGGSRTIFGGVRVTTGGTGDDAWELLEPVRPAPPSAPLVVVEHGYYDYSTYDVDGAFARHAALKGNVVIYPRWQTAINSPCPGPFNIEPCIASTVTAMRSAIAYLHAHRDRVQPRLGETSYFGFSFGGIITVDMLNRFRALRLPRPRAVFLDDPHDGGLTGIDEPAAYSPLSGLPPTTRLICHAGTSGVISQPPYENASCNSVFPRLTSLRAANKNIVLTGNDSHGSPPLKAEHGVCAGPGSGYAVNVYDWGFCWKGFDALRACALYRADCTTALGETARHRYIGTWSDGVPIMGLKVQTSAPIRPDPAPARQPPPASLPDRRPTARLLLRSRYRTSPRAIRGTAGGPHGAQFAEVAIVRRAGRRCRQMTTSGRFAALRDCLRPTAFLWATGDTPWTLELPARLRAGAYTAFARAIDAYAQPQTRFPAASRRDFTVG